MTMLRLSNFQAALLCLVGLVLPRAVLAEQASIYVNAGGNNYVDGSGNLWVSDADFGYYVGNAYSTGNEINGTSEQLLYQTERWDPIGDDPFVYTFDDVENGIYEIKLHFAEIYADFDGYRIFDVAVQGNTVIQDLDIHATAGYLTAHVETVEATVTNGVITIEFLHTTADNPKISAIEIHQLEAASVVPTTIVPSTAPSEAPSLQPTTADTLLEIRVNAGGPEYVDSNGKVWEADEGYYNTGYSYAVTNPITGTDDPTLFQTERWDLRDEPFMTYTFDVLNGEYEVNLLFAEIYMPEDDFRVFDVSVQGQVVLDKLDIHSQAGFLNAYKAQVTTSVSDGVLKIQFLPDTDSPKLSAIEIIQLSRDIPNSNPVTPGASPAPTAMPTPQPTEVVQTGLLSEIRVNFGGEPYIDGDGRRWESDVSFFGYGTFVGNGYATSNGINGTTDDYLFQTERWAMSSDPPMRFTFDLLNGEYEVNLLFAEIYANQLGWRIFDVVVQGQTAVTALDIFSKVGNYAAYKETVLATVTNGELVIEFIHGSDNPKISAIEILQLSGDTKAPTPTMMPTLAPDSIYINAGGGYYMDGDDNEWFSDDRYRQFVGAVYQTGNPISGTNDPIDGTSDPILYQSERYLIGETMRYEIPVPNGNYEIKLHFAEIYFWASGLRLFHIAIQGTTRVSSYDIFAEAGGQNKAIVERLDATVDDEVIVIELIPENDNSKLSAIEVHRLSENAPPLATPVPTASPTLYPTASPTLFPTAVPTPSPQSGNDPDPTLAPSESFEPSSAPSVFLPFSPYHINVGGDSFIDKAGNTWDADNYATGGTIGVTQDSIDGTDDPQLYQTERWGANMVYEIPVPNGDYEITLHFAEIYWLIKKSGERVFNVKVEGNIEFSNVDIFDEVGGYHALKKVVSVRVVDEFVTIEFEAVKENPKLSAIEVTLIGHYAHAVPGGPYLATDKNDVGAVTVTMDGSFSHTHGPGARLFYFKYFLNGTEIGGGDVGTGLVPDYDLEFPVGKHTVWMEVGDTDGSVHRDFTTVTVRPFGFPDVESLSPDNGDIQGGETVTILGYGFNYDEANTTVHFGQFDLTGPEQIRIVSNTAIEILSVPPNAAGEVSVSVETPKGVTNKLKYRYINFSLPPVKFYPVKAVMPFIYGPSSLAFGPDGKLYVSTVAGTLYKLTLNDNHQVVDTLFSDKLALQYNVTRTILGIAFDPMDTSENPAVYVTHSYLFHGEVEDFHNGKVTKVSGANLDIIEDVITGLPVSDHDHAVNGLEFGDHGELYIQSGGNTNAGVPGEISQSGKQDEGYFSVATLVAYLSRPDFDGKITHDQDYAQNGGFDVEVFASGLRNSYDIVLHSNGNLYATDNGANNGYGAKSETCSEEGTDPHEADKLNLVVKGGYYGHPNRKRGATDPRQCTWWSQNDPGNENYTAPIAELEASSNGIVEFQSNHFGGQLRGHLIIGRYQGALFDITLSETGNETINNPATLVDEGGLDVTQGPDGSLFVAQNFWNKILVHVPDEIEWTAMLVKSVFPRRGPLQGGSSLTIYGVNLSGAQLVSVGGENCPLAGAITETKIQCQLPAGNSVGWADVVVWGGQGSATFSKGYKYITGTEV